MQVRIEWMDVEDVVGWSIGREGGGSHGIYSPRCPESSQW